MSLYAFDPLHVEVEEIHPNLEAIYNEHARHTHLRALEAVFAEGYYFASVHQPKPALQRELDCLIEQHNLLQKKYDALNAKFNINQPTVEPILADEMQTKVISQAMGMGDVFRCGRTV